MGPDAGPDVGKGRLIRSMVGCFISRGVEGWAFFLKREYLCDIYRELSGKYLTNTAPS